MAVLNERERKALDQISYEQRRFSAKGELPAGIGRVTLDRLVRLGLLEEGRSERFSSEIGWRVTPDGWRCMFGKTLEEIMSLPEGSKTHPLKVWSWPPSSE